MSKTTAPTTSTNSIIYIVDIPFENALRKSRIYNCVKDAVINKVQSIPDIKKLKFNLELTFLV